MSRTFGIAIALSLLAGGAHAHTGHPADSFVQGMLHPLTGIDHLVVMLLVGLWGSLLAQARPAGRWLLPADFVGGMILGAVLPQLGVALPAIEPGIIGSMILLGGALLLLRGVPLAAALPAVALFGAFHGYAHGAEAPTDGSFLGYAIGFVTSTALLHLAGIGVGAVLLGRGAALAMRALGAAAMLTGIVMAAA